VRRFGSDVPVILRPVGNCYMHVVACYIKGLMNGEAMDDFEKGSRQQQEFEIR